MLHRRAVELVGDTGEHRFSIAAIVRMHAHLDEAVRRQRQIDLVQHSRRQAVLADADDGMQMMGLRAEGAPLRGIDREHARSVSRPRPWRVRDAGVWITIIPMTPSSRKGRTIVEWLLLVVAIVIGVPAAAWLSQERLIFFPQPLTDTTHLPAHAQPLEIVAKDGTRLAGFMLMGSARPAPVLLYFGGNAEEISWTLADRRWPAAWTVAGLNYRGYGRSEGRPGEPELVADGLALFDAIAARPEIDPRRIVVVGRSLGTGVAARLAAERPVAGAVLISPFDSLVEIGRRHYPWLPVSWLLRHRFDSIAAAKHARVPLLTIVGTADGIIPLARSRVLHDAWGGPKQWVAVDGAGHNDLGAARDFWESIPRFLETLPPRP